MSFLALSTLQGASLIAGHATLTKILVSCTLRTYQFLETDADRKEHIESSHFVKEFQKAQLNESEYAALLTTLCLYLSTRGDVDAGLGVTLAVVGQIGYVWSRSLFGYPSYPVATCAMIRFAGLAWLVSGLFTVVGKIPTA